MDDQVARNLSDALTQAGHVISPDTVERLLNEDGYSLQGNAKTVEGKQHPDRNGQFRHINALVTAFQAAGNPVISVDTKKKELVGNYKNGGKEQRPKGTPERVEVHDFKGELGRAVPYGVYDMTANAGWVNVGTDADTGQFAVESIRRWWNKIGKAAYPGARRLLITADSGGSNGSRLRLWKVELARLATELGLEISVSHLPPGTSKKTTITGQVVRDLLLRTGHGRAGGLSPAGPGRGGAGAVARHHPRVLPAGPGPGHGDRAGPHAARRRSHRSRRTGQQRDRRTSHAPVPRLVRRGPGGTGPGPDRRPADVRVRSPSQDQDGPQGGGPRHRRRDQDTGSGGDQPGAPDRQQAYRSGKAGIPARPAQRGDQGLQPGFERPGAQDQRRASRRSTAGRA